MKSALSTLTKVHGTTVHRRRVQVLAEQVLDMLPADSSTLLDVGCGDGVIDALIIEARPELQIRGVDVFIRQDSSIPTEVFDGSRLPLQDKSIDLVMMLDVLHHTNDPNVLLAEARRVARKGFIIKDHTRQSWFGGKTLVFMDWVGNRGHGVRLPYNYWSMAQWHEGWSKSGWKVEKLRRRLGLYPAWARPIFEWNLHFIAYLV